MREIERVDIVGRDEMTHRLKLLGDHRYLMVGMVSRGPNGEQQVSSFGRFLRQHEQVAHAVLHNAAEAVQALIDHQNAITAQREMV